MKKINSSELSNKDKIRLIIGKNCWQNNDLDGKLPLFTVSDGPLGIRHPQNLCEADGLIIPSVSYPAMTVLANTWNLELALSNGEAIANDAIEKDIDVILGPGINIKRIPINGRNFEYFSEDPYLTGMMAQKYIKGIQNEHIGTCLKHFLANNSEDGRHFKTMQIDEVTLNEIYLKPFELALKENPSSIMCSYNKVNDVRMSENKEMYDILRNNFKYNGLIVSDWDAVKNPLNSLHAGLNLEMPFNNNHYLQMVKNLDNNSINMKDLDFSCNKILDFIYSNEENKGKRKITLSKDCRLNIAKEINHEGIVLLKNNNVLPIKKKSKVLIIGNPANKYFYGGGSSEVTLEKSYKKLYQSFNELGIDTINDENIINVGLTTSVERFNPDSLDILICDYIIITCGEDNLAVCESRNRETINISRTYERIINEFKKYHKPIIVALYASGAVDVSNFEKSCDAILFVGYGGETVNDALADIITGSVCPSGKLSETFPIHLSDVLSMNSFVDSEKEIYEEKQFVGYRYFISKKITPMYEFGFGLSYASFKYSNFDIYKTDSKIFINYTIENNSLIRAKEISQIYIEKVKRGIDEPQYKLIAFSKDLILSNNKKEINIVYDISELTYYDVNTHSNIVIKGDYIIHVGRSSLKIEYSKSITI